MLLLSSRTATKPTRRAHAVTPPSVAALPIPKHEACTSRVRSGLQGPSGSPVAVSRTMGAWRLGPQRAASANDTHMISRLAAHGQQAALLLVVVATDAQPRWPSDRACERGKRGHHQTPFVSCTTGTIKNLLNHRAASPLDRGDVRGRKGVQVILQQAGCAWGVRHILLLALLILLHCTPKQIGSRSLWLVPASL
jgi:hypothetical protein